MGTLGIAEYQLQWKLCQILNIYGTSKGYIWCEHFRLNTPAVSGVVP